MHNFVFTSYEEDEPLVHENVQYMIFQREKCPKTGKLHYQGYIELIKKRRLTSLKKVYPKYHIESRKGTQKQAIDYCKKEETRYSPPREFGIPKQQGKRNDILTVRNMIDKGNNKMREIIDQCSSYQSVRMAEKLLEYKETARNFKPFVFWLYGKTGSGKTRTAKLTCDFMGDDTWMSLKTLKWWQGYDAHECVIFDDFRRDFCTYHELLRILDRYEYRIENKGGSRQFLSKYVFITTQYHPADVYNTREDLEQLLRRIDIIMEFK